MPPMFPLDIEEIILNLLADEDDEGHSSLKTCSLVCQAFLPICRKHIYRSITLNDSDSESPTIYDAFERLLRETPKIADCIRTLDYTVQIVYNPSIQETLKRISRLEFFSVRVLHHYWHEVTKASNWSDNPIRPALLHLLHLPTLTRFKVAGFENFLVSDLIPCVNLKYLEIGRKTNVAAKNIFPATFPDHPIRLNEFVAQFKSPDAIMKLCTAQGPNGQPIIDFTSLSKITVGIQDLAEGEAHQELFRRCHFLTNAHISFWRPRIVKPSLADMLRPSMQTLKHIVVDINGDGVDDDPLFGILSEFEDMRIKNNIETVTIEVQKYANASSRGGDDWCRLDEVFTTPGWFSLKQVSLAINIARSNRRHDELKEALRTLPEMQFPRLSSSNSISFEFAVVSK